MDRLPLRATAFLALLFVALPASAGAGEAYQIRAGGDWRSYSLSSTHYTFGYNLEAAKIFYATSRAEFTAGGRLAYYPNQRDYAWSNGSMILEYYKDNRLFYAGVPLTARYHFSTGRFAPFVELKNLLDVRVLQQTEDRDIEPYCFGLPPQTCVDQDDAKEVAQNTLLVWRQILAFGLRMRLKETSFLLSEGIQWDVTPSREPGNYTPPARGLYLSTNLGISF